MAPLLSYCYITKEISVYEGEECLSKIDQQTNRSQVNRPGSPENDEISFPLFPSLVHSSVPMSP